MRQIVVSQDGNARCAVFSEFVNLQESPAGFGNSDEQAIRELLQTAPMRCRHPMWWGWGGPAGHCNEPAFGVSDVMRNGYYLCWEIAKCSAHGGPTLDEAVRDLAALAPPTEQPCSRCHGKTTIKTINLRRPFAGAMTEPCPDCQPSDREVMP